jgi:hypothetical protein
MKRSKFSEEQVAYALWQAESDGGRRCETGANISAHVPTCGPCSAVGGYTSAMVAQRPRNRARWHVECTSRGGDRRQ